MRLSKPHPCSAAKIALQRALLPSLFCACLLAAPDVPGAANVPPDWEAPDSLAVSTDGARLFVACAKTARVLVLDAATLQLSGEVRVPNAPSGLVLSRDGRVLYVTCAGARSTLAIVDAASGRLSGRLELGHTAMAPVLSPDGETLYACNRFSGDISVVNLRTRREVSRIAVDREPVAAAITPDGTRLLVANHLHAGRSDGTNVAARISVIDTASRKVVQTILLPNGSGLLRGICISPDGRHACVTHLLSRYFLPTTQIERGWMNSNALTIIDLATLEILNTVLLDNVENGAANPWACGFSPDGRTLFVTHAGTHEVSLIQFPGLLAKLSGLPKVPGPQSAFNSALLGARVRSEVPSDFGFLAGLRERIPLQGKGPRSAVVGGSRLFVAGYFSDDLEVIDLANPRATPRMAARLSPEKPMGVLRRGEFLFNDGTLCLQGWQSCASCHSEDARVDGLNWDLLNDGVGNPKNSKSLLFSHQTPPVMSLGVRETAEMAVRAGIRNILFTRQPDEVASAMDEWLKSLTPIPSPWLVKGKRSASAQRGEKIFNRRDTGCAGCHAGPLFTDLGSYAVGTGSTDAEAAAPFDTPTLIELWRTGPYLHDGSAVTIREVLVDRNQADRHGHTSQLKPGEIEDLAAFLLSL